MSYIFNETLTVSTGIGVGGTPISGGTDTCVLFQRGTAVGEDTNFKWNYTSKYLTIAGANNPLSLGVDQANTAYNILSFTGGSTVNDQNIIAGSSTDSWMYFNTPAFGGPLSTTGGYVFQVAGNIIFDYGFNLPANVGGEMWTMTTQTAGDGGGGILLSPFVTGFSAVTLLAGNSGLTFVSDAAALSGVNLVSYNPNNSGQAVTFYKTRATASADSTVALQTNDYTGNLWNFGATGTTNSYAYGGGLRFLADGNWTGSSAPLRMEVELVPPASTTALVRFRITATGSVLTAVHGALTTTATDGFLYIPTCAGAPTGAPTAQTGMVAIVWDTTNHKFWVRDGATWRGGTAPGVWS